MRLGQWEDEAAWEELDAGPLELPPPEWSWEPLPEPPPPQDAYEPEPERPPPQDWEPERPPPQDEPWKARSAPSRGDEWWEDLGGAQGAIVDYLAKTGGSFTAALAAIEDERSRQPDNIALRDAEHALVTQQAIATFGPLGAVMGLVAVPAYSVAKWVAQTVPEPIAQLIDAVSPIPLRGPGVTPPSWSEVRAGLWSW